MSDSLVLCLDCGATNVRAIVVNARGELVGKASQPNSTYPGVEDTTFHTWDLDRIVAQLSDCAVRALADLPVEQVVAATITTFGVDGAFVHADGSLAYPVISWKCPRSGDVMQKIGKYLSQSELNKISGVGEFAFNTINKLIWLIENRPDVVEKAHAWLFISNLIAHRLTGVFSTDRTMAGTSQLTDIGTGDFSAEILGKLGLRRTLFPTIIDAGRTIGNITPHAAEHTLGIPALAGVPVISCGHDTQFALFGSGAEEDQPVLSSGTWEILMVRAKQANLSPQDYAVGATAELDANPALRNPGLQWIASGLIEWVKSTCYKGESFDTMDAEALDIPPGCEGVKITPDFLPTDSAPQGTISGLVLGRTRAHIYRAAMEALTLRLKSNLARLESVSGFKSDCLVLVGGGARNKVWTQIRANMLQLPIKVSKVSESTVLGASIYGFWGAGVFDSPEAARHAFGIAYEIVLPNATKNI